MTADELIEAYVADVAVRLPRKQRNDVAFELRALLQEELLAKAEDIGGQADAKLAVQLLRAFGRPIDVAARYRPTLTIIDPADGHAFLRASTIGLLVIWTLGFITALQLPVHSAWDYLSVAGHWWVHTLIPSLWWPGVLVVGYAASAWTRRRWPNNDDWTPRSANHLSGGRSAMVLGLLGVMLGLWLLINPHWILDVFWGGSAAPAAYKALSYTEPFLQRQAPILLALIALNIPLYLIVLIQGCWSAYTRHIETIGSLAMCAVSLWTVFDGPMMQAPASDAMAKFCLLLLACFTLIYVAVKLRQRVRPAPG